LDDLTIDTSEDALSIFLAIIPHALVSSLVWPFADSMPIFFSTFELALVAFSVSLGQLPISMHFVYLPVSSVFLSIRPVVLSETVEHVIFPGTNITGPISPLEDAEAFLLVFFELPFKGASVWMFLVAMAVFHVVFELSLIPNAIGVNLESSSFRLAISELTFINLLVFFDSLPHSMLHAIFPFSVLPRSILEL
jgi:hypothetical protein